MKCSVEDPKIANLITSEIAWAKEVVNRTAATQMSRFIVRMYVRMNGRTEWMEKGQLNEGTSRYGLAIIM